MLTTRAAEDVLLHGQHPLRPVRPFHSPGDKDKEFKEEELPEMTQVGLIEPHIS